MNQINQWIKKMLFHFFLDKKVEQKIKAVDSLAKKCSCSTQIVQTHQLPAAGWLRQGRFVRRSLHFFTPNYPRPFARTLIIVCDNIDLSVGVPPTEKLSWLVGHQPIRQEFLFFNANSQSFLNAIFLRSKRIPMKFFYAKPS